MSKRGLLYGCACLLFSLAAYGREGFGFTKKAIDINRVVPPAVNINGTRVTVSVDSDRNRVAGAAATLRQYVEKAVLAGDKKLEAAEHGDLQIVVALDRLDTENEYNSKVVDDYRKEKDSKGKDRYVNHPTTKTYTTARGDIGGVYRILDSKGHVLDSGDIDRHYNEDFEYGGAPSRDRLRDQLLDWAADRVAARVVPTHVRTKVLVPKGSFEQYIPLAESGAFDQYLKAVESVSPMKDRGSDAFREYALGIAHEGLAYQTEDPKQALELLRKAAEHYQTAAANNPQEKLFAEKYNNILTSASGPIDRIAESVQKYEQWASGPTRPASNATTMASAGSGRKSVRNKDIVDMTKAGLTEENILLAIDNATAVDFDTTPDGLISLSKAGVSKKVIAKMQKK